MLPARSHLWPAAHILLYMPAFRAQMWMLWSDMHSGDGPIICCWTSLLHIVSAGGTAVVPGSIHVQHKPASYQHHLQHDFELHV